MGHLLNVRGRLLDAGKPLVMGILNVTPDSFYDGGKWNKPAAALEQARQMLEQGAAILDVGGMSSRPGAERIRIKEEKARVLPVIQAILDEFPQAILSIDTVHGEVARAAVGEGAAIINDISAGKMDAAMYPTVAELNVPYILMHMRGSPKDMQQKTDYDDPVQEVLGFLTPEVHTLRGMGVKDIVIDPGFGFGKTVEQNYTLLKHLSEFQILGCPILAGLSRKSMIYQTLGGSPDTALNGTTALHIVALQNGASLLRVHDAREAIECVRLWEALCQASISDFISSHKT